MSQHVVASTELLNPCGHHRTICVLRDVERDGIYWTALDDGIAHFAHWCHLSRAEADEACAVRLSELVRRGWKVQGCTVKEQG